MTIKQKGARPFAVALVLAVLAGCDAGGANSSGAAISVNDAIQQPTNQTPSKPGLADSVELTTDNARTVASSTLKAALLSDISTRAVSNTLNLTQMQNAQISDLATGVVVTMQPVNCLNGGSYNFRASLESNGEAIQIDFAKNVDVTLRTSFTQCDQGFLALDGSVALTFNAVVNDWLAQNNFTLNAQTHIDQLTITQSGYAPFVANGYLNLAVYNPDAETTVLEVTTNDIYYASENTYLVLDYESHTEIHLPTGDYQLSVYSRFVDEHNNGRMIEYQTIEPLRGNGLAAPNGGKFMVFGSEDSMEITVTPLQTVELAIDYGNDQTVDEIQSFTWNDLALDDLTFH